jgi:hypothetical protein
MGPKDMSRDGSRDGSKRQVQGQVQKTGAETGPKDRCRDGSKRQVQRRVQKTGTETGPELGPVHGRHSLGRTTSLTPRLQLFTVEQQTSHTFSTPYTTTVQIMPVVEASTASSKTIAALFAIPIVILFLCIWLAVSCSERWNKSDNRVKRYLERKKRVSSTSERSVDEETQT